MAAKFGRPIGAAVPPKVPRKRHQPDLNVEVRSDQRRAAVERMKANHKLKTEATRRLAALRDGET